MSQHEWNGAIQSHAVVQLILKHIQVVETVGLSTTGKQDDVMITPLITTRHRTYTVGFSASESACSGIPYTWLTPGNEISIPMELGPDKRT